jgi:hypothetical protein
MLEVQPALNTLPDSPVMRLPHAATPETQIDVKRIKIMSFVSFFTINVTVLMTNPLTVSLKYLLRVNGAGDARRWFASAATDVFRRRRRPRKGAVSPL